MIYTRWGSSLEFITGYGKHQPEGFTVPVRLRLVKAKCEDNRIRYQFVEFLKADEGPNEIETAYNNVSQQTLSAPELAKAIQQAS